MLIFLAGIWLRLMEEYRHLSLLLGQSKKGTAGQDDEPRPMSPLTHRGRPEQIP